MNIPDDELACDYVLDRLDPRERTEFEARLVADDALRQRVRDYEDGLAARIFELPPRSPSRQVWARIAEKTAAAPGGAKVGWGNVFKWGIAAMIAISLASIAAERWIDRPTLVVVALDQGGAGPNRVSIARVGSGPNDAFAQLAAVAASHWEDAKSPRSFVVYDPTTSQGFIAVRDLPRVAADTHYQVWILNRRTAISRPAGDLNGSGLYSFAVDPLPGEGADDLRVIVTREKGSALAREPGTDVVLGG
ncbi:MAG TPA: anti-sigma factor [Opitutaceae bacterium]|jgi:anti-sigma-K factor RskA